MNDPKDLITDVSKELIKPVYDDLAHPAMMEGGKALGRIPRAINAAFSRLDKWILKKEYSIKETELLLEQKLQNIASEKIVPPEPYVAVPALQAISYSMDSAELRNLYANLLARSINVDEKEKVHPSFVEIIKGLSPIDCKVFNFICGNRQTKEIGCIFFREHFKDSSSYSQFSGCFTAIDFFDPFEVSASLDNLARNSLIKIENFIYNDKTYYSEIRENNYYIQYKAIYGAAFNNVTSYLKDIEMAIKTTDFGKVFYDICVKNPD